MDTEELLVHDRRERQGAERLHAGIVDLFRILVFTLQLEGEIVRQMAALMVSAQQPKGLWVPNLQRPEIENTLMSRDVLALI